MLKSMTGYGRGGASGSGFAVSVEIRTVNHRYLDFYFRLPREFTFLEDLLRQEVQKEVHRGRVELYVAVEAVPAGMRVVDVDYALAETYYQALQELGRRFSLPSEVSAAYLGSLPEVISLRGLALEETLVEEVLREALAEALQQLLQKRREEGENLAHDLKACCRQIEKLVAEVKARSPLMLDEYRLRLEKKLRELLPSQFEDSRILMECAILAERTGINEELVRLQSHLESFFSAMNEKGPVGRKLDFIAQEMLREVNTIGSKVSDYQAAGAVIEMKAALEKIREQVQNIE